jgi:hypothetical protein
MHISKVIPLIRPGAIFSTAGDEYSGLTWLDENQEKPTESEIEAAKIKYSYLENRAGKYPPVEDYLDGIVKGDQKQIDKYIADCLAVKAEFPKPD